MHSIWLSLGISVQANTYPRVILKEKINVVKKKSIWTLEEPVIVTRHCTANKIPHRVLFSFILNNVHFGDSLS